MKNAFKIISLVLSLFISQITSLAQDKQASITVTGTSVKNLSPNEIIIKLDYEEYFTDAAETSASKILLESIEKKILACLKSANIKDDKITMGEALLYRPRDKRSRDYLKRRLKKSLFLCINNNEEYVKLIRQLEQDNLLDKVVSGFSISDYKHTEKEKYLTQSRTAAFANAKSKAELILSETNQKLGKVITIEEVNTPSRSGSNDPFSSYEFDNSPDEPTSGFKPIVISYNLKVVFEIL